MKLLWRSSPDLPGLAGGSALSLVPVTFAILLEALRRTFAPGLAFLNTLFMLPLYLLFQGVLIVWGAYIFSLSPISVELHPRKDACGRTIDCPS